MMKHEVVQLELYNITSIINHHPTNKQANLLTQPRTVTFIYTTKLHR